MTAFDDLSLLRTFVCIVECGSISAAARRLKNPQPTLSRHLRLLEEHCGAVLLRRDTRRMSLTRVIARPAGKITLSLAASPSLIKNRLAVKQPGDLKSWPWVSFSGVQFWSSEQVKLFTRNRAEQTLHISPVLISEDLTSVWEAVRAGLGVAVLPDWMSREDLLSGRLERVLPQWTAKDLPVHVVYPGVRLLPTRVRTFIDFAVSYMTKELGSNAQKA